LLLVFVLHLLCLSHNVIALSSLSLFPLNHRSLAQANISSEPTIQEEDEKDKQSPAPVGVVVKTIKAGDATHFPKKNDTARVHYVAKLEDGSIFDSSRDRQVAFNFIIGKGTVIRGIDEEIVKMSRNQICRLTIPPNYAYGPNGYPPVIPANATLTFEIELISFSSLPQQK
jgi:FKBP-type peptidyl-prolyl cis-trans isomerase